MKVLGFSHITLNVSNLERSLDFYCNSLKMKLRHKGKTDAYLEWGTAWICLIQGNNLGSLEQGNAGLDHVAFYISEEDFQEAVEQIKKLNITIVRGPVQRGRGWSINFLDPDGIELELHTSNLDERMKVWI
ncbi:glutathione transferase [Paenibacillus zeisoli]|uniref:Glutathione transferase n=1 Tax=Paenibacillus zeisoli TaxID=2496267 RepID=A0A433X293_9BACL|nr:VOC family protein [Paenibacillus zeisoli]RUT28042.1 glutathione transferase [Paenibacillus zeisoli]